MGSQAPPGSPSSGLPPVALFGPSLEGGGAERSLLNLATALAEHGRPVDLILARAAGPLLTYRTPAVQLIDLRARRMLTTVPGLVRYLRRRRPVVLLSTLTHGNLASLLATLATGRRTRLVVVEHNMPRTIARQSPLRRDRWALLAVRVLYPLADSVVAVSPGVARELVDVAPRLAGRVRVVPNIVVTRSLWAQARQPIECAWFQPGEPPVILFVGRLARQKDPGTLLRAFADVRKTRPVRLLMLGEGPERGALEAEVARRALIGDVALPGFDPSPYRYLARAGVFVLPSRFEGLPTVLIEALALGTPIVATDCPSGPREILAGGRLGRLVPVGDAAALAQAIRLALDAGRPVVPAEAWQPYTAAAVLAQYEEVLGGVGSAAPGR